MTHPARSSALTSGGFDVGADALPVAGQRSLAAVSRSLYDCLGHYEFKGSARYVVRVFDGRVLHLRSPVLASLDGLLQVYPDIDHWRRNYPRGRGKVDTYRACSDVVTACTLAGLWSGPSSPSW